MKWKNRISAIKKAVVQIHRRQSCGVLELDKVGVPVVKACNVIYMYIECVLLYL